MSCIANAEFNARGTDLMLTDLTAQSMLFEISLINFIQPVICRSFNYVKRCVMLMQLAFDSIHGVQTIFQWTEQKY
jgi:hypothetical protein